MSVSVIRLAERLHKFTSAAVQCDGMLTTEEHGQFTDELAERIEDLHEWLTNWQTHARNLRGGDST